MKIGFVLDDTLDSTDGIQQYVVCVGEWLRSRGHEVHYLVGESARGDLVNVRSMCRNVRVDFNGNRLSMPRPAARRHLRRVLDELQLDVLHVQVPYSPFMGGRLVSLAHKQTAVVGTFHICPFGRVARIGSDILGKINTTTARRFDAMMAVSEAASDFAGASYGFRSLVVVNPFHHDQFSVARRGAARQRPVKKVVFLGRLVTRKGPTELLKAVAYMEKHQLSKVPYQVIIAGKGKLLEQLQRFTRDEDLTEMVSFPGFIAEADKASLLASADVAVFPSISGESFGISLLEAMAAGRGAVLAGNNPGYASVVASKNQLIEPLDTPAFAQTLASWLQDDAGRAKLAKRQQAHVAKYDIDLIGPKIEAIYQQALQKRRSV